MVGLNAIPLLLPLIHLCLLPGVPKVLPPKPREPFPNSPVSGFSLDRALNGGHGMGEHSLEQKKIPEKNGRTVINKHLLAIWRLLQLKAINSGSGQKLSSSLTAWSWNKNASSPGKSRDSWLFSGLFAHRPREQSSRGMKCKDTNNVPGREWEMGMNSLDYLLSRRAATMPGPWIFHGSPGSPIPFVAEPRPPAR